MFRGFLIVLVTLVVLIATVVGVVGAGLRRIAAAQQEADANWHRPESVAFPTPATNPSNLAVTAADEQEPIRTFESIDLWAKTATLHGAVQVMDPKPAAKGRIDVPPADPRGLSKWERRARMGGQPIMTFLTGFHGADDYAEWRLNVSKPGDYEVDLTYACPQWQQGGRFSVTVLDKELSLTTEGTRNETSFRVVPLGKMTLPAGNATLTLRGVPSSLKSHCFMNLRSIQIIPVPTNAVP